MDGAEHDRLVRQLYDSLPDLMEVLDRSGESMPDSVVDALGEMFGKSHNEVRKILDAMKP